MGLSALKWIDKYLDFYKIGSGDLTCYPLIEKLAKKANQLFYLQGYHFKRGKSNN